MVPRAASRRAQRAAGRRAQRGVALLALLAVAVMVFAYVLTSRLNAASQFVGIDREHNAMVLARAKRALIGYMAQQAAMPGENNPGHLPCPEAPANFGTANEGIEASFCAAPAVGRLPWRTLGLEKLVDAAGEPLWYAVSNGWHRPSSTATLTINSDSPGQLNLNGPANDVVAVIIAPGPAITVLGGGPCTGWPQSHPTAAPPDVRDYLECGNEAGNYVTGSPGNTFNDQVLRVATADVLPALEAAIADRMQQEIAPVLKSVYASAPWKMDSTNFLVSTNPLYPFAAPFANPGPSALSPSNYRGTDGNYQGLLPFTCSAAGCASDARYEPTFVSWDTAVAPTVSISGAISGSGSCTFPNTSTARCTGTYLAVGTVTLRMTVRANNVAMALRQLDPSRITIEHGLIGCGSPGPGSAATGVFQSNGSADLTLQGTAPGLLGPPPLLLPLSVNFCMTADLGVLSDHPLLDPTSIGPGSTGWFVRNEWYRLVYYAAAWKSTADGLSNHGCQPANCLKFNDAGRNIRALLVLAGQSLSNPAGRPNGNLADYLEYQNADLGTQYEQRPARTSKVGIAAINAPFNDRVILVDWESPPVEFPQVPTQVFKLVPLRVATCITTPC